MDIIFKDNQPQKSVHGGAIFNTSLSLARVGTPSHLVTAVGNDKIASMLTEFMSNNKMSICHV